LLAASHSTITLLISDQTAMAAPAPHPVGSTVSGQDPVQSMTDGVEQIAINGQSSKTAGNAKQGGKKEKKAKADNKGEDGGSKAPLEFTPTPGFFADRMKLFDRLQKEQDEKREKMERKEVEVTLPDGKKLKAIAWQTRPMDIAKDISKSLSERIIISKVRVLSFQVS
jgi:threonyl-tRNA synthetase